MEKQNLDALLYVVCVNNSEYPASLELSKYRKRTVKNQEVEMEVSETPNTEQNWAKESLSNQSITA